MNYKNTERARFLDRPNRFIAHVELQGRMETVHVKNTGRCRELLIPGCEVILEKSGNPSRKTRYDLICVCKNGRWINMDSQAPNRAAEEWLKKGHFFEENYAVYREKRYGNSRFDLYIETITGKKVFIEVKGVTLEEDHIARFPDAPTERGVKHVRELSQCVRDGYMACLLFVIQMDGIRLFRPNWNTHAEFGRAVREAESKGVKILAYDCLVEENKMEIQNPVPVDLEEPFYAE